MRFCPQPWCVAPPRPSEQLSAVSSGRSSKFVGDVPTGLVLRVGLWYFVSSDAFPCRNAVFLGCPAIRKVSITIRFLALLRTNCFRNGRLDRLLSLNLVSIGIFERWLVRRRPMSFIFTRKFSYRR